MDSHVYITGITNTEISHSEASEPRERFVRYYEDLYRLYNNDLNLETFYQGGQCSFSKIGEQLLDQIKEKKFIEELDILISAYWSHEYDPDYSNCIPYLKEKYQLNCDLFDICEQGTLASFTGLHILQHYLLSGQYEKGMMIVLEQTTIPRGLLDHHVLPTSNGGCALSIESTNDIRQLKSVNNLAFKVIDSIIFDSSQLHLSMKSNLDVILDLLMQKSLSDQDISIITKKNSVIWKQMQNNINHGNKNLERYSYEHISSDPSILSICAYLGKIINREIDYKSNYMVIIDEDIETLNIGVLFLEIVKI